MADIDYSNAFTRAADTEQISSTGESMEDSFFDYITYGTVSAITSAAVGFYNTGVALGDAMGIADDDSYAQEANVINSAFGEDTAAFYQRHKTGIDLAGFVAGSFIPGGAAIGALRAAQRAGKLTKGMSLASGMKTSDLVLGSRAMKNAKSSVMSRADFDINNPAVWRAYGRGLGQQVAEATAAESAIILTSNQNAAINPDNLGYFEAAKSQALDAVPFVLGAGGIGGAMEAFRIRGALKRTWKSEWDRTRELHSPELPAMEGMSPGDKVVMTTRTLDDFRNAPEFAVEKGDDFGIRQKQVGENIIKRELNKAFIEINQSDDDTIFRALDSIVNPKDSNSIDFDKLDELLSGLDSSSNFTRSDFNEMQQYYSKTNAPFLAARVDDIESLRTLDPSGNSSINKMAGYIWDQVKGLKDKSGKRLDQRTDAGIFKENWLKDVSYVVGDNEGGLGVARPRKGSGPNAFKVQLADAENGIIVPSAFSSTERFRPAQAIFALKATNSTRKRMGLPALTKEDHQNIVELHELTHAKANTPQQMNAFAEKLDKVMSGHLRSKLKSAEFFDQIIELSKRNRKGSFEAAYIDNIVEDFKRIDPDTTQGKVIHRLLKGDVPTNVALKYGKETLESAKYLLNPTELLADAGAQITYRKTAEAAAKDFPLVAKFFDDFGGIAKSFTPTKAYYNVRTGQTLRSYLPGVNDFGKMSISKNGVTASKLNRTFKRSTKGFQRLLRSGGQFDETFKIDHDYLDFSAQYAIAQKADLDDFKHADGNLEIDSTDVPMLERVLQEDWEELQGVKLSGLTEADIPLPEGFSPQAPLVGQSGKETLEQYLTALKLQMRGNLAAAKGSNFNEHEIAHILNMDVERAMGFDTGQINLMGVRPMDRPEVVKMNYTNKLPADYKYKAHSAQATQERFQLKKDQREKASAVVLGEGYELLKGTEKFDASIAGTVSGTETRSWIFGQSRPDFGSVREMATSIGNVVRKLKENVNREITEDFANHIETINQSHNGHLRAELASATNLMSRDWYRMAIARTEDGTVQRYMVKKDVADNPQMWGVDSVDDIPDLRDLNEQAIQKLDGMVELQDQQVVRFSDEVGQIMELHQRRNSSILRRKNEIAKVRGRKQVEDSNVLYAPPRDLSKTKHFAFVIPGISMKGADARKFMVYGTSAEELSLKTAKIKEKYGNQYKVVTNQEAKQYKQLTKEYDSGLVFDEMKFDQAMFKKGTSAELEPNIDLQGSYTLDRLKTFHHRQEEYLINAAVEMKYADGLEQLRRIDEERSKFAKSGFGARETRDSIWKDTERLLFDDKGAGDAMEQLWVRINDFIGEEGSKALSSGVDILRETFRPGTRLTQESLDEYNRHLADKGFDTPFTKVSEALIASPNLQDSRLVNSMVKTMNNLSSTLLLRLDQANSIIQVMSSPILMMPVLKEAKEALRGTADYDQLRQLTTVKNPHSGLDEPSSMKMVMNSVKRFWSPEGKEFLKKMRDRGMVSDFMQQYLDATDFSKLNGRHNFDTVNAAMDKMATVGSKMSLFNFSEEFTRFLTADAVRQISEIRGIPEDEMFSIANSAIDKVHGIHRTTQRVQLFNGPLGQSLGLYQSYFFNFVQNALKWAEGADRKKLAMQAAMQGSIFGLQSFPGFTTFNNAIGEANADEGFADLYTKTGAMDEGSLGQYMMYGLGSHALGFPIDFYSRGDLAVRNRTVIPTSPSDFPAVSMISKAVSNISNVATAIGNDAPVGEALLHGLAHNGMSRPLQGLGQLALDYTSSGRGTKYFDNSRYVDYNAAEDWQAGVVYSRLIGSKPLNESIYMNQYFKNKEYQANMNKQLQEMGTAIQLTLHDSAETAQDYTAWANRYEEIGGDPENFKSYFSRQLTRSQEPQIKKFKDDMEGDTSLGRLQGRLNSEYSEKPIWEY